MRNYRTKEDDVAKISTSIFVTNFPESFSAKDLFQSCKQYGHVVDTFSPIKGQKLIRDLGLFGLLMFSMMRAMILDDECLFSKDVTNSLMGRVKDFFSLSNLKTALTNEVILERDLGSVLQQAKYDFTMEGRIVWVEVEEIMEVSDDDEQSVEDVKGGDTVVHEVGNHGEDSDVDEVSETMFDESSGQKKKQSEDPFGIYPLLDKQRKVNSHGDMVNGESLKYPLGFTPIDATEMMGQSNENVEKQNGDSDQNNNVEEPLNGRDDCSDNMGTKPDDLDSGCQGDLKSLWHRVLEDPFCGLSQKAKKDWVKELCVSNKVNFLTLQKTKMESMELITIKSCWGNYAFDYVHSDAVVWVKTGANILIVAVYAPHDLKDKCLLWDYLTHAELIRLKGELQAIDGNIDNGNVSDEVVSKRTEIINSMLLLNKIKASEAAQKAKIKCSVEGDENSRGAGIDVSKEELKRAVWDCGMDKSPGPDGFTFGFFRRFWSTIENDVYEAVTYFFTNGVIPKGCNSSFIALIPKTPGANMVKDFRPISLIGCMYKIIAKISTNRLVGVIGDIVNEVQSAFIADRQILDVRWDFLDEVLQKFSFGNKWRMWIQSSLRSSRGFILVNGSPTEEFQFYKGLKQGDPLSPFLFILIMESLHLSFQRVVDAGMFTGGKMSRVKEWNEVVDKVVSRLSKWKMKTLSIGERLTLLKSLESIRNHFFNGNDLGSKKATWIKWSNVLADKAKGGLGVNVMNYVRLKLGNGQSTSFWEDNWINGGVLKDVFPRLYALEMCKKVYVSLKLKDSSLETSFCRKVYLVFGRIWGFLDSFY
nr:RNA-directed DNA polymerase, eukaryota, reverse transcriptase zinc-binding domain protein [Tanacetum cinerariifolium]